MIKALATSLGVMTENQNELKVMVTDFYKNLYLSEGVSGIEEVLDKVPVKVTEQMNAALLAPYTNEEVKTALFQMFPTKAPGPDGFPARFYQQNWNVLREDVINGVLDFFERETLPEGINDTVIVLIPKGKDPQSLKDYRPISLCNVIYKVISKCLVNRLRPFLDDIISETQSAFIPGRLITDNAAIAFECFHKIQHSISRHNTHCAYKLDLEKAYDRVD